MAVEMHGVGGRELVLDDDTDGAVGSEVVDVPLGVKGIREVALIGEDEDRVTFGRRCEQWENNKGMMEK